MRGRKKQSLIPVIEVSVSQIHDDAAEDRWFCAMAILLDPKWDSASDSALSEAVQPEDELLERLANVCK
jgi:hypothetical protein